MLDKPSSTQSADIATNPPGQSSAPCDSTEGVLRRGQKVQVINGSEVEQLLSGLQSEFKTSVTTDLSALIKAFNLNEPNKLAELNAPPATDEAAIAQGLPEELSGDAPSTHDRADQATNAVTGSFDQYIFDRVNSRLLKLDKDNKGQNNGPILFAHKLIPAIDPSLYDVCRYLFTEIAFPHKKPVIKTLQPISEHQWQTDPTYLSYLKGTLHVTSEVLDTPVAHSHSEPAAIATVYSSKYHETDSGQTLTLFGELCNGHVFWL